MSNLTRVQCLLSLGPCAENNKATKKQKQKQKKNKKKKTERCQRFKRLGMAEI
jgi:hypothetical protein